MGLIFGLIFGATIDQVLFPDNFAFGMSIGMSLGLAVGTAMDARKKNKPHSLLLKNKTRKEQCTLCARTHESSRLN